MIAEQCSRLICRVKSELNDLQDVRRNGVVGGQTDAADLVVLDPKDEIGLDFFVGLRARKLPIGLQNARKDRAVHSRGKLLLHRVKRVEPENLAFVSHQFVSIGSVRTSDVARPARILLSSAPGIANRRGVA